MAFDPQKFIQDYSRKTEKATSLKGEGFDPQTFIRTTYPTLAQNPIIRPNDLGTIQGLYKTAQQMNLGKEADKILAKKGEKPKEIFSGGFITDIFDALNALQYGITGILKGKGFSEGVKTRQSFSDQDALGNNGIPGVIGGILLDIAVDPLTYIAPWTILKKVGLLPKIAQAVKWTEGTKVGQWFGRKFIYMYGADPVFKEIYERSIKNIAIAGDNISTMVKKIVDIPSHIPLLKRDATGRFIRRSLEELSKELTPKDFKAVREAWNKLDDLGREAVDLNLLGKRTWEEHFGEYIKNAYLEYEKRKSPKLFGFMKLGIKGIKKRVPGLTLERMKELGQIDNPAYLLFKSMIDLSKDIENAKLFRLVNERFAVDTALEGFKQLPKTSTRLGDLRGKYVPENIYDYIQEISEPTRYGIGRQLVANFKYFKVILNPATHARNVMSNQILNWWKLGMNPLDPRVWNAQKTALGEIARKSGKWIDEAKTVGYNLNTFAGQEIRAILDSPEALIWGKKLGKTWTNIKRRLGDIYQGEENFSKLTAFIFNRQYRGMGIEDAWRLAESATFNYSQVTPFIRMLRESLFGFPFITFCVSPDTEILTQSGWKTFDLIDVKNDLTLAYDIKTKELKWQKIEEVFVFPYIGKMVSIKGRSLDILMTPDHRNVIERTLHRRKTENRNEIIIEKANKLTKADKIIVAGNYVAPIEKTIPDEMVELVGWFVTEGYLIKKYNAMFIGQTNKEGQKKIEDLRIKLGVNKYHISLRTYKLGGYKPHKVYYFPAKIRDEILKLAPNKELRIEFLRKLTKDQLELLYQTILLADGYNPKNKKNNPIIIQNKGTTADSIQILGIMLGKQFGLTKHGNGLGITITKGYKRQLKRNMPQKVDYEGIVWCPKTKLGTWVARRNGKVFITGNTIKATPIAIETALKAPRRISVFGKIKNAIENMADIKETEREKASVPQWIRDGFWIKVPIKDRYNRSVYFDLSYIIPFGDLISGNYVNQRISRETGLPEGLPMALLEKTPLLNLIRELARNQDFYGDKIWRETDTQEKQLGDMFRHIIKMYSPPLLADQLPGGWKKDNTRRTRGIIGALKTPEEITTQRTLMQELLKNIGLKIQPIDVDIQETFMNWEKRKALETLLLEKGGLREFERIYMPK